VPFGPLTSEMVNSSMMIKKKTSVQPRFFTGPWNSDSFPSTLLMLSSCKQTYLSSHHHENFC